MVRLLYGISGAGKTDLLQTTLIRRNRDYSRKKVFVVETAEHNEYSDIFNPNYITVLKPDLLQLDMLFKVDNSIIIFDCNNMTELFLEKMAAICRKARMNNNDVLITFQGYADLPHVRDIYTNTNRLLIGKLSSPDMEYLEELFKIDLNSQIEKPRFTFTEYVLDNNNF